MESRYQQQMQGLSQEQKEKFALIIFKTAKDGTLDLDALTINERRKLKSCYAQKIAHEAVANSLEPPPLVQPQIPPKPTTPNFLATICCCLHPEQQMDSFCITTEMFLLRLLRVFMLWRNDFFDLKSPEHPPELYGPLWVSVTYMLIISIAANLNVYFVSSVGFKFDTIMILKASGLIFLFVLAETLIYTSVMRCLGGTISMKQVYIDYTKSIMLIGYSTALYIIPSMTCIIPSLYWHVGVLVIAGLVRAFYLFRNFGSKIQSRSYILSAVFAIVQGLYVLAILKVMLPTHTGHLLHEGTQSLQLHSAQFVNINTLSQLQDLKTHGHLLLRHH